MCTINTSVFGQICAANKAGAFLCQKECNIEPSGLASLERMENEHVRDKRKNILL